MISIKIIHITCALISISGFILRGIWMLQDSLRLQNRFVKTAPHIIDTMLLVSGISLAVISHQTPLLKNWLMLKLTLLLAYIVSGSVALKYGRNKNQRSMGFGAALICYILIVYIARNQHTLPLKSKKGYNCSSLNFKYTRKCYERRTDPHTYWLRPTYFKRTKSGFPGIYL